MDQSPTTLQQTLADRYLIDRKIGEGGMATVHLARDLKHARPVAIKVLRPEISLGLGTERFLREIEILARLQHPHILPLYDSGEAGGIPYYVMPYLEGDSLRTRLRRERQLPVDDATTIARQVAGALAYAHAQGVVHRDIKPENVLFSGGEAIVADFGISKALATAGLPEFNTSAGFAVGTPHYMSPEQAGGESVDGRSDQYALACLLFEMLSGEPPYTGASPQAIVARHMAEPVRSVRITRPTVPPAMDRALTRALAKAPADRFPTVWQFSEAIGLALATAAPDGSVITPEDRGASREPAGGDPHLGRLVHKTCDRWKQVNAFDAFVRSSRRSHPGQPMVVVTQGEEGDGHESIVERLVATRLLLLANQLGGPDRGLVQRLRCPWPTDDTLAIRQRDLLISLFREADPQYLEEDLRAIALLRRPQLNLVPIVAVQHDLRADEWDDTTEALLRWYLREFWGERVPVDAAQVVVFLNLVYRTPARGGWWPALFRRARTDRTAIQGFFRQLAEAANQPCPILLAELHPVTLDDVTDWLHRNNIYLTEQRRRETAAALFGRQATRRLAEIEGALEAIHSEFVRTHLQERGVVP